MNDSSLLLGQRLVQLHYYGGAATAGAPACFHRVAAVVVKLSRHLVSVDLPSGPLCKACCFARPGRTRRPAEQIVLRLRDGRPRGAACDPLDRGWRLSDAQCETLRFVFDEAEHGPAFFTSTSDRPLSQEERRRRAPTCYRLAYGDPA